jgi:hypothetical protein
LRLKTVEENLCFLFAVLTTMIDHDQAKEDRRAREKREKNKKKKCHIISVHQREFYYIEVSFCALLLSLSRNCQQTHINFTHACMPQLLTPGPERLFETVFMSTKDSNFSTSKK